MKRRGDRQTDFHFPFSASVSVFGLLSLCAIERRRGRHLTAAKSGAESVRRTNRMEEERERGRQTAEEKNERRIYI